MKKSIAICTLTLAMSGLSFTAQADILRFEMGAGLWQTEPSGTIKYGSDPSYDIVDKAGFDKEDSPYVWAYLKHPIPIVPNIRLEYADTEYSGNAKQTLVWNGNPYTANSYNELQMSQLDATLYYNLLDNTFWMTLDLGLQVKYIDGEYLIRDTNNVLAPVNEKFSGTFPLGYLRARVNVMSTGIGVEAIGRGIAYKDSSIYDAQLKVDYTLDMIPFVKPGLELGYRVQSVDFDHSDIDISADVDVEFKGFFGGVTVRF